MEMTIDIDESIKELSKWRKDLNYDRGDYCYGGTNTKHSLDVAINIMRKYQKIQEIVKSWEGDTWTDGISEDCMEKISEVLRNGKA